MAKWLFARMKMGCERNLLLRLYNLMLGACHGFYDQGKVCPWKTFMGYR